MDEDDEEGTTQSLPQEEEEEEAKALRLKKENILIQQQEEQTRECNYEQAFLAAIESLLGGGEYDGRITDLTVLGLLYMDELKNANIFLDYVADTNRLRKRVQDACKEEHILKEHVTSEFGDDVYVYRKGKKWDSRKVKLEEMQRRTMNLGVGGHSKT